MRTWADISFEAFAANLAALGRRLPRGGRLLLPVKADAYGHGAVTVARWAEELGVGWLGVGSPEEGIELREAGVLARLLLFGPLPEDGLAELRGQGITPTLCSVEDGLRWARAAPGAAAHVEVDTGMGRSGFDWRRVSELARLAEVLGPVVEGAYTHFAAADSEPEFTLEQRDRFRRVVDELAGRGLRFRIEHLSHSAALLRHPEIGGDLARPGIAAYGALGATGALPDVAAEFQPVLRWWSSVAQLKEHLPGDTVGYGRTARVERPTPGALLAVGYGDGYPRSQAARGWALIRGARCPLLGRVSMDFITVDVSAAPGVWPGDPALLMGDTPGLTADDLAARSGTISYEILTGIGARVGRRAVREAAAETAAGAEPRGSGAEPPPTEPHTSGAVQSQ